MIQIFISYSKDNQTVRGKNLNDVSFSTFFSYFKP